MNSPRLPALRSSEATPPSEAIGLGEYGTLSAWGEPPEKHAGRIT